MLRNLKALDRVDWDFVFYPMQKFKNGDTFIHIITVACTNIQSKVKINGLVSDAFTLMRGVCQECPLSVLLYIIVAKVLGNTNRRPRD